jgi:polysaccharide export outer membrane protein
MQTFRVAILASLGACLAACASPQPIGTSPGIQLAQLNELPSPTVDEAAVVRPLDTLRVSVFGFPDLSREFQVNSAGNFPFPLIGLVQANGRTPNAIAQEIASRLEGRYVVNPEVTIDTIEQPGRLFTVGGEVKAPGRYPMVGSMSLLEAVATAKGTSDMAGLDDVLIFRTVEGQRYIGVYNLAAIQRGNYPDPAVYADDIVQVGDSPARRRLALLTSLTPLLTPLILLDRLTR